MISIRAEKKCLIIIAILIAMTSFFISCKEDQKSIVDYKYDPELIPSIWTDSVDMLISSDSGYIQYRVVADLWGIYDRAKDPYWLFPKGVHLEQYDTLLRVEATIDADTAWHFTKKGLWKLKGNVVIQNTLGEKFTSEEFYRDEKTEKVYSNAFVTIYRPGKMTIHGQGGFEANQQFTDYKFFKVIDSPFSVNENETSGQKNDSISTIQRKNEEIKE